jgi:thiol:disulfide interchange protein
VKTLALIAAVALAACGKTPAGGRYDASRDAASDIQTALAQAKTAHKRVLVEAGGNWCSWCKILDRYFEDHADLAALREKNYVLVRVNVESGGPVPAALKSYPAPAGYPHLYVLDENGTLIQSQDTSQLEKGETYDPEKLAFFLNAFGPPRP